MPDYPPEGADLSRAHWDGVPFNTFGRRGEFRDDDEQARSCGDYDDLVHLGSKGDLKGKTKGEDQSRQRYHSPSCAPDRMSHPRAVQGGVGVGKGTNTWYCSDETKRKERPCTRRSCAEKSYGECRTRSS